MKKQLENLTSIILSIILFLFIFYVVGLLMLLSVSAIRWDMVVFEDIFYSPMVHRIIICSCIIIGLREGIRENQNI